MINPSIISRSIQSKRSPFFSFITTKQCEKVIRCICIFQLEGQVRTCALCDFQPKSSCFSNPDLNSFVQYIQLLQSILLKMSTQPKLIASAIVKIIVLGSVSVGKSSLILKYASINRPAQSTIAIDILTRKVKHEGKMYELQLWDTAGHERYFSLAQAAIVVFDLDDAKSLDEARDWFIQISLHSFKDIPKILVGNKSDLWGEEELAKIIEGLTKQFDCQFCAVSARTGINLEWCFLKLLKSVITRGSFKDSSCSVKLNSKGKGRNGNNKQREQGCC